jgi:hypothetical protein
MFQELPKMKMPNGELVQSNAIKRLRDGAVVPFNVELPDYQEYLQWLAEGNEPLPADEPEGQENS